MRLFHKPYIFFVISLFLIYIFIAVTISGFYNTVPLIFKYAQTLNWLKLGVSILFSTIIAALVSLNIVAVYIRHTERKQCRKEGTLAAIGTAGGLAAGICPLCTIGLLPLILGIFGITFSFATLPFNGLEIQALSILLLSSSLWMLLRTPSQNTKIHGKY